MLLRTAIRNLGRSLSTVANIAKKNHYNKTYDSQKPVKWVSEQMGYLKMIVLDDRIPPDWSVVKSTVLSKSGEVNEKNINAIILKSLIRNKKYESARSFVKELTESNEELSLGTINTILKLYYEMGVRNILTAEETQFIRHSSVSIHEKYKYLDPDTSESLINSLAIIGDWEQSLTIFDVLKSVTPPSGHAYGSVISALLKVDKKEEAIKLMKCCIQDCRVLNEFVYKAWVDHARRKAGRSKVKLLKELEEINKFISVNCLRINVESAQLLHSAFENELQWNCIQNSSVSTSGKCLTCKTTLDRVPLSDEEFSHLQSSFKDQVLVGNDIFLKTSPEELKKFLIFIEKTAPYDIVLDVLNITYAYLGTPKDKMRFLISIVKYFLEQNKHILLLGREHMNKWPKYDVEFLYRNTTHFITDNLSSDDPFFLTAALFSGNKTDLLTKDKLRGHRYLLTSESLRTSFLRWQWEHQWTFTVTHSGLPNIKRPLNFTPCAQKNVGWHVPYEPNHQGDPMNGPSPIPDTWLCLQPTKRKIAHKIK